MSGPLINDEGYRAQAVPSNIRLKVDANEGPPPSADWFPSPRDTDLAELAQRYPAGDQLEQLLATKHGCDPRQILITAGGDEALERLCRLTLSPESALLLATPTFEMLERYANTQRAKVIGVPWQDRDPFPAEQLIDRLETNVGLLALVTPNNPTGAAIPRETVEQLIGFTSCPVLLDLAYCEFADDDLTDLAMARPGVVAVRTFSKAWGLAGLRVGYAVGDADLIRRMRMSGSPFSVSALSRAVARTALVRGSEMLAETVRRVRDSRDTLERELTAIGFAVAPSQANFVLARHPRGESIWAGLRDAGVLVRRWPDRPGLGDALRITCPTQTDDLALLIETIRAVRDKESLT